jgi:hypothetical protein
MSDGQRQAFRTSGFNRWIVAGRRCHSLRKLAVPLLLSAALKNNKPTGSYPWWIGSHRPDKRNPGGQAQITCPRGFGAQARRGSVLCLLNLFASVEFAISNSQLF